METFRLTDIVYSDDGKKISYQYKVSDKIKKYFNFKNKYYVKYDKDVSDTPFSISVIPLLANIMPISWFVGFDVYIDEVDNTFFESLQELKKQFSKFHPDKEIKGTLHTGKKTKNTFPENNSSLLFSGGLDSFESLTRNLNKKPYLISIHGADVAIEDTLRWNIFKDFNEKESILDKSKLLYIESNLRDFYTYKIELLVDLSWWGTVQHGMALLGVLAPLSYKFSIKDINIASSATNEVAYSWGSTPAIDENMKWANTKVTHDGYHLRRTDKIDNVVEFVKQTGTHINLRVCYSELRNGANCNICHKCQRTMLGLILSGANPEEYGFNTPPNLYDLIFKNFGEEAVMTKGLKYQWTCLQDKAKESLSTFYVLENKEKELKSLELFIDLNLDDIVNKNAKKVKSEKRIKFILRNKLPFFYNIYKKLRY